MNKLLLIIPILAWVAGSLIATVVGLGVWLVMGNVAPPDSVLYVVWFLIFFIPFVFLRRFAHIK